MVSKVSICEVGPRDGLQSEPELLSTEVKKEFITRSINAGIKTSRLQVLCIQKRCLKWLMPRSWLHPCLNMMMSLT